QLEEAPARARIVRARVCLELDRGDLEPRPREDALHEAVALRHLVDDVEDLAIEQSVVTGVRRDLDARHRAHDLVVRLREVAAEPALLVSLAAHADHHVVALAPLRDELRNQLGWVLQITVDRNHRLARRMREPRRQRDVLAEVAREPDDLDAGILRSSSGQDAERAIST